MVRFHEWIHNSRAPVTWAVIRSIYTPLKKNEMRSADELREEARRIGGLATTGQIPDNSAIQVLAALLEELADRVAQIERERSRGPVR